MILALGQRAPLLDPTCWVAPGATVVGEVVLEASSSVWYGAVLRGDGGSIRLGRGSNVQDGCALHTDPGFPIDIGAGVSIGHGAVVHGCTVEDDVLIGMGAVVMNGAVIGSGSMLGAGAVVSAGTVVPPGSLVVGVPGKVRRPTTDDEQALVRLNAEHYVGLVAVHRDARVLG